MVPTQPTQESFRAIQQREDSQFIHVAAPLGERGLMAATILLVNADPADCIDWRVLLGNQGYKVIVLETGMAAVDQCPIVQPDLVLLHSSLPDMSGFEVCRQLKADPLNRLTPVVLITTSSEGDDTPSGASVGADDFWGRPASRWEALSRVQTILQLKSYIDAQAESVVLSLARSLEAKHPLTEGHSERLVEYAMMLGQSTGLSQDDLSALRLGCQVHDIGKIAVPDAILFKPGPLTAEEVAVMHEHPAVGEKICAPMKSFRAVLPIIRHHHERMDGSGYPDGLRGEDIPLTARVLQVVDVYDALTTHRPYRRALSPERAFAVLAEESKCGWLDESLVRQFLWNCHRSPHAIPRDRSMLLDYFG